VPGRLSLIPVYRQLLADKHEKQYLNIEEKKISVKWLLFGYCLAFFKQKFQKHRRINAVG